MIQISLEKLKCLVETDEVGADEPFVLVAAVNYSSMITVQDFPVPIPSFEVVRYGPFEDVDKGEIHFAPRNKRSFWSLTNSSAVLTDPDNVIFIVALVENDDGDPEVLRGITKGLIAGSVFGSLSMSRQERVNALIRDINSGLRTPTGAPNFDDRVGHPQELRFSAEELNFANTFIGVKKELQFTGDGGKYTLTFEAANPTAIAGRDHGFKIRQISSQRFIDAYETADRDFSIVTRPDQTNETQRWAVNSIGGVFTIRQQSSGRFVDAHEISSRDFSLVTSTIQSNDTQKWVIIPLSNGTSTIQQLSSGRFVDAYERSGEDFSVVTRDPQNDNSQKWIITPVADSTVTIQQASNRRFIDAHESSDNDFSLVTRTSQDNETQRWLLNQVGSIVTLQQRSTGRFVDAYESSGNDFSLVTRPAQGNDTQRWVVLPRPDNTTTIQQLSTRRFIDAHEVEANDFSAVTREAQNNTTQQWEFIES